MATRKALHDSKPYCDEFNNIETDVASTANSTQQDDVVAGMPTMASDSRMTETPSNIKEPRSAEHNSDTGLSVRPLRGDNWTATHGCEFWHSVREEEGSAEERGAFFGDDDQDTAAGDYDSNGPRDRSGDVSGAAHHGTYHESDVRESAPRADDTISELSCSGIFTIPSEVGDEQGNEDQGGGNEGTHDSSSESPNQTRVATPRDDDDDMGASHVEHLIQERRRWKLRAFESEHELAGFQSLRAQMERRDGGRGVEPRSAGAIMLHASGSFSESVVSETSTVESGFDLDDRWQTASGNDRAPSTASSCSTPSVAGVHRPHDFLDTASDAQFSGAASATFDGIPASGVRCDTGGLRNDCHNLLVDCDDNCDGQGQNGGTQQQQTDRTGDSDYDSFLCGDSEQGKNGTHTDRLLREEIAELKENLRKAELRHAAAEATAASVLQRARAAELSRDVKEIQVGESLFQVEN